MSLNDAPSGERARIGFFGVRNAGKSSVVNAVTGQQLAVVSDTLGTTTDPVVKNMELLPAGPVTIIDTPGIDDAGELGEMRVAAAKRMLRSCDVAVLVVDATKGLQTADEELVAEFERREVPYAVAFNKSDLFEGDAVAGSAGAINRAPTNEPANDDASDGAGAANRVPTNEPAGDDAPAGEIVGARFIAPAPGDRALLVSAKTGDGIHELKERIAELAREHGAAKRLIADLLDPGDVVVLVMPIDESAPKGRIILPQQMTLRDILDARATAFVCQPDELAATLASLKEPPRLVVTDSQAFGQVAAIVPREVPLTSFSILMMRYKGELASSVRAAAALAQLTADDRVLISEGCTHHRQCGDIGTVKMPAWIRDHCGHEVPFDFTAGGEFPDDLSAYACVVHCGGCMLNEREMKHRMQVAREQGVPFVNYGMAIAQMHGILERSMEPFEE